MKNLVIYLNKKIKVTLSDKDYLASGGEGTVYIKKADSLAFKIYHDPKKCIPEQKMLELQQIGIDNVIYPKDIIYNDSGLPLGFTMRYVKDTEYLCKLFVKNFKTDNNISSEDIVNLVTNMQKTLIDLHKKRIIVADYNEMNFLVDNATFQVPYYIDVDSYQTPHYKATAIMDSVRDRKLPFGQFNEMSDWFSWAIVTFQLYMGIHPFKGMHPKYTNNDLENRMKDCISVFDSEVKVPKFCRDYSVIPKKHLEWYKKIFEKNERCLPPFADGVQNVIYTPDIILGTGNFLVDLIDDYKEKILDVVYINGERFITTDKNIYRKNSIMFTFANKPKDIKIISADGDVLIAAKIHNEVGFLNLQKEEIGRINANKFMRSNNCIYTLSDGKLIENYFVKLGKVKHLTKEVCGVTDNAEMFEGIVFQNIFGKYNMIIPYEKGKCSVLNIPELNGYRIINSKRINRHLIVIGEKAGKYDRFVIYFAKDYNSYTFSINQNISQTDINFIVKQNGLYVGIKENSTLEIFGDFANGIQETTDSPVDIFNTLYDGIDRVLFTDETKLYAITSKSKK